MLRLFRIFFDCIRSSIYEIVVTMHIDDIINLEITQICASSVDNWLINRPIETVIRLYNAEFDSDHFPL